MSDIAKRTYKIGTGTDVMEGQLQLTEVDRGRERAAKQ